MPTLNNTSFNTFTPIWAGQTTSEQAYLDDCPLFGCDPTERLAQFIKVGNTPLSELGGVVQIPTYNSTNQVAFIDCYYYADGVKHTCDRSLMLKYASIKNISGSTDQPTISFIGGEVIKNNRTLGCGGIVVFQGRNGTTLTKNLPYICKSVVVSYRYKSNNSIISIGEKMTFDNNGTIKAVTSISTYWGNLVQMGTYTCILSGISFELDTSELHDPLIWTDTQTDFENSLLTMRLVSGTETKSVTYDDCTFSNTPSIDYDEDISYVISVSYEYSNITYASSYSVRAIPNTIKSISTSEKDTTHYYSSWNKGFVKPTFSFTATKHDGTTVSILPTDSDLKYYNDSEYSTELSVGDIVDETTYIYVDYKGMRTKYEIVPIQVVLSSIENTGSSDFTRGRKPNDYTFSIKATYNDGTIFNNWNAYTIVDGEKAITDTNSTHAITFRSGNIDKTLTFNLVNPQIKDFYITDNGSMDTTINDGRDTFDITKTKCHISYKDTMGDIGYETECSFASTLAKGKFTATPNNSSFTPIDGSAVIDMGLSGVKTTVQVVLNAYNEFNTSENATPISVSVSVTSITSIKYITAKVSDLKTEYKVGQSFLDSNDTSKVTYGYDDGNGDILSDTCELATASSLFNISPMPGTKFSTTGTKTVIVRSIFDSSVVFEYTINVKPNVDMGYESISLKPYKLTSDHTLDFYTEHIKTKTITIKSGTYVLVESRFLTKTGTTISLNGTLATMESRDSEEIGIRANGIQIYGYIKDENDTDKVGKVVLFHDYKSPVSGESNIKVKFPCYDEEASSFVDKCTFGVRFGHNNSLNRLFLSGNPKKPNFDIHSVEPYSEDSDRGTDGDFSYFPDEAITKYGESDNAICGYDVVSDNKLLVLKTKAGKERTIYFRYPTTVNSLDSSGVIRQDVNGNALTQEEYGIAMSNSPIAGVSSKTIANFNGDSLFVSNENQVVGLDIEGIVGDSQRQANTRSAYIDPKLKEIDLKDSILFTTGDYALIETNDGLFVSHRTSKSSETSNYEWFPCEKTNANMFFEDIDGTIYYGTKDGGVYKLAKGQYTDTERYFLGNGNSAYATVRAGDNGYIIIDGTIATSIDTTYKVRVYESKTIAKNNFYERICDIGNGKALQVYNTSVLKMKADSGYSHLLSRLIESADYYICQDQTGQLSLNASFTNKYKAYTKFHLVALSQEEIDGLEDTDPGYAYFYLADNNGTIITDLSGITYCGLACPLNGEYDISKINGSSVFLSYANRSVWIARMFEDDSSDHIIELTKYKPICCKFITAPFLIDSPTYIKSVMKIDLLNATLKPCDLQVSVVSNKTVADPTKWNVAFKDKNEVYSFDQLSFDSTTFSKNIVPTVYSVKHFFPKQRFFCLAFISNNSKNSVLPGVEITYTINGFAKASQ